MKTFFQRLLDRFYAWWIGSTPEAVQIAKVYTRADRSYPEPEPLPTPDAHKEPEALPPLSYMPRKAAVPAPDGPIPLHFLTHQDVPKWVTEYEKEDKPTYAYYYAPNGNGGSFKRFAFSGGHRTGGFGYKNMDDLIDAAHRPWED